jgi:hypothetical protein
MYPFAMTTILHLKLCFVINHKYDNTLKLNLFHVLEKKTINVYLEPSDLCLTIYKIYPTQPPDEVSLVSVFFVCCL